MKFSLLLVMTSLHFAVGCQQRQTAAETESIYDKDHKPLPIDQVNSGKVAWRPLDKVRDGLTGVGVLNLPVVFDTVDVCTAFLLDSSVSDAPAYILTNAHCTLHAVLDPLKTKEVPHNLAK